MKLIGQQKTRALHAACEVLSFSGADRPSAGSRLGKVLVMSALCILLISKKLVNHFSVDFGISSASLPDRSAAAGPGVGSAREVPLSPVPGRQVAGTLLGC